MVQLIQGQARRVGGCGLFAPLQKTGQGHATAQATPPIVEITRHQHRLVGWNFFCNVGEQLLNLTHPTGRDQTQMNHQHMHQTVNHLDLGVQQTTLLKAMVRHVLVLVRQHRPAR